MFCCHFHLRPERKEQSMRLASFSSAVLVTVRQFRFTRSGFGCILRQWLSSVNGNHLRHHIDTSLHPWQILGIAASKRAHPGLLRR